MEQQITVAINIINYFYNELFNHKSSFQIPEYVSFYNLLKHNYIVSDDKKIFLDEIHNEVSKKINLIENDDIRKNFKTSMRMFIEKSKTIDFSLDNSDSKYFKLCNASEDKIYVDPELKTEEINTLRLSLFNKGLNEVEIHSLTSFLNPAEDNKLINPTTKIVYSKKFEAGKEYNFSEMLKPFLRDSMEIKIIDNYAANYISRFHIEKLLKSLKSKSIITIFTLSREDYLKNKGSDLESIKKAEMNYSDFERLSKRLNIEIKDIEKAGHLERYIITDKYEILLPGGFDQFDKDGKPYKIDENKILKMVIEKK
jgi:hypothetical protein